MNFLKKITSNGTLFKVKSSRKFSSSSSMVLRYETDPSPLFINPEVQKLLKSLTNPSLNVVFNKRTVPDNSVHYKFMTTEDLMEEFKNIVEESEKILQMPPVVQMKEDSTRTISVDKALSGFSDSKYVVTDITFGLKYTERKVVVRNIDGTLEYASDDIAKRMKQTYIPAQSRKIREPLLFQNEEAFNDCLSRGNFKFLLDRLCVQYEPYEKTYHELTSKVYNEINEKNAFDSVRSTRHFGPLVFYLCWHKMIDNLLCELIEKDLLRNAVDLIILMSKLHKVDIDQSALLEIPKESSPTEQMLKDLQESIQTKNHEIDDATKINNAIGKTLDDFPVDEAYLDFIEKFVKNNSLKKIQLASVIQSFREQNAEKKQLLESLRKSKITA